MTVRVSAAGTHLTVEIRDDGRGFDVARDATRHALGLASMEERALALAGRLVVASVPGAGTTIRLECPLRLRSSMTAA